MSGPRDCVKCGGRMADGFVADQTYGSASVSRWYAGQPQRSIWTGLKLKKIEQHDIATWRCARCGFLESYAP